MGTETAGRICCDLLMTGFACAGAAGCNLGATDRVNDGTAAAVFACDAGTDVGGGSALGPEVRKELGLSPCRRITSLEYCRVSVRSETKPCSILRRSARLEVLGLCGTVKRLGKGSSAPDAGLLRSAANRFSPFPSDLEPADLSPVTTSLTSLYHSTGFTTSGTEAQPVSSNTDPIIMGRLTDRWSKTNQDITSLFLLFPEHLFRVRIFFTATTGQSLFVTTGFLRIGGGNLTRYTSSHFCFGSDTNS